MNVDITSVRAPLTHDSSDDDPPGPSSRRRRPWIADANTLTLIGHYDIDRAAELWAGLNELLDSGPKDQVTVDVTRVESIDGACVAMLVHLERQLGLRGVRFVLNGAKPELRKLFRLHGKRRGKRKPRRPEGLLTQVGRATVAFGVTLKDISSFIGELFVTLARGAKSLQRFNLRDASLIAERAGADAVPIVLLINFLVGFVMAYQSARQLERFGANILVADLVGIAVVRELGPLMTAIIMCGRTGAAFAAELGTMKVSEEVDALRTFGISPMQYLVVPRILALVVVAPVLTLLADGVGILGGVVVGMTRLGISAQSFITELSTSLKLSDVVSGLVKSVAFGGTCAAIACQRGLSVSGGAAEVGHRTTSAVVTILFSLIVLDAVFTIIMEAMLS